MLALLAACDKEAPRQQHAPASLTSLPTKAAGPLAFAESLYFRGEFDSAAAVWKRELDVAAKSPDTLKHATVLMWLGLTAWRQGDNALARSLGEQSLGLKKKLAGDTDISRSYNALGLVARDEGRLRDAAALFSEAIASARANADTGGVSRAAANMALVSLDLGEFAKARDGFVAAREAGRALGDARVEGNALNNLGMLTIRLGDPASAIPLIDNALQLYRSIKYSTGEQNSLAQLATAHDLLGDPQRALGLLDSASRLARAQGLRTEEASNLRLMGEVYQTMEDHRRALSLFAQGAKLSRELGLRQEEATALRSEAASHAALGRVDLARERTSAALRIHRAEQAAFEEFGDLLMLAELSTLAGDDSAAAARLVEAHTLTRRLNSPSARAELALTEARVASRRQQWEAVLRTLEPALTDLARSRAEIAWEPLALRARALARLGMIDSAAVAGRSAIAAAERVRGRIASAGLRTGFTSARAAVYADQVLVLLRLGRPSDAFEVADAARGRALIEHLSQARSDIGRSPAARGLVQGESLLRQIDELISLLDNARRKPKEERGLDDQMLNGIATRIAAAERDYEMLMDRAAAEDPERAALIGVRRVNSRDVQRALQSDEALLEYLVADDRLFVFIVRPRSVKHVEIPVGDSSLSLRVRLVRELLARPTTETSTTVMTALSGLHELLVRPVLSSGILGGVRRLILIPHSSLSYLPFAALRDERRGRYLGQDYALLNLPSAGALALLRGGTRAPSKSSSVTNGGVVFAPFSQALPATRVEARAVKGVLAGTRTLVDDEASEAAFRAAADGNRVLHLATHSTLNAQNPLFSRIELARPGGGSTPLSSDDGRLSVHELIGIRTDSPLVFLSGCETALGSSWSTDFVRGEDYATLSQALLYSGAGNVVATLWRINDESAAVFASHFYSHLKRLAPAEALAAAQQNMLTDRRFQAPYHWAAYQVAGSGARVALRAPWWNLFGR